MSYDKHGRPDFRLVGCRVMCEQRTNITQCCSGYFGPDCKGITIDHFYIDLSIYQLRKRMLVKKIRLNSAGGRATELHLIVSVCGIGIADPI